MADSTPTTTRLSPARSPACVRMALASTSTARAVSPGCLDFFFFAGGRRLVRVRVRVATVATTVTAATTATHQPVLALDRAVYGPYPPRERAVVGLSDLHDDGDDHRAAPGALVDEAAGGLADVTTEGLEVGGALGGRFLQALEHGLAGFLQQVVRFGGVHPAPGEDLGAADHLAGAGIDGDHDHHHPFLTEHPAIAEHAMAHVADDAVDVEESGRHLFEEVDAVGGDLDDVAVFADQHSPPRDYNDRTTPTA